LAQAWHQCVCSGGRARNVAPLLSAAHGNELALQRSVLKAVPIMHALQAANHLLSGCRVEPPVKNTFIHFNLSTSENDAVAETEAASSVLRTNYHRSHSDPVHGDSFTSERSMSMDRSTSTQSSLHSLPQSGWAQGSSHVTEVSSSSHSGSGNSFSSDVEALKSEDRDGGSHAPPNRGSAATRDDALELPKGVSSVGALGHGTNTCKPCAWSWKPGGCVNGKNCEFCHMCSRGELKRRRKERVAVLRKSEQEDKQQMARAGAVDEERIATADSSGVDSTSLYTSESTGHDNASSTAMTGIVPSRLSLPGREAGYSSTKSAAMVTTTPADGVATATPVHYSVEVTATHLPAKRNTRISL